MRDNDNGVPVTPGLGSTRRFDSKAQADALPPLEGERRIAPVVDADLGSYPFYALVLPGFSAAQWQAFLRAHWNALDQATGDHVLVTTPVIPDRVSQEYLQWWRGRLSDNDYEKLQVALSEGAGRDARDRAERQSYDLAERYGVTAWELPVMIVTSGGGKTESGTLILHLDQRWDQSAVGRFFQEFVRACADANEAAPNDPSARLAQLSIRCQSILAQPELSASRGANPLPALGAEIVRRSAWALFGAVLDAVFRSLVKATIGG